MEIPVVANALKDKRCLSFLYDGETRLVEPHALGRNSAGDLILRGFQIAGGSGTASLGWKLFKLDKAEELAVSDFTSIAPRPGYKPGDRAMATILVEIAA